MGNEMQNGGEAEEERGETNEMQRSWHPTGKVMGNVIGGVVGKLRGDGNEMEREECQNGHCIPTQEKRGINEMQNAGEEKREESTRCKMQERKNEESTRCKMDQEAKRSDDITNVVINSSVHVDLN